MNPEKAQTILLRGLRELGLDSVQKESDRLLQYIGLIAHWNRRHNLTAVRDPVAMVSHHLLDSLSILRHLPGGRTLDLGSGAGLPGIPLAIADPSREIVLVDASFKRVVFLREVIRKLELPNLQAVHARAEQHRSELYDLVVTRGFASLARTVQLSEHLLSERGLWVAMKGRYPAEEIAELEAPVETAAQVSRVQALTVPGLDAERHLVLLERRVAGNPTRLSEPGSSAG